MSNSEVMLKAFLELHSPLKDYGKMRLIQDAWKARDDEIKVLRQELAAMTKERDGTITTMHVYQDLLVASQAQEAKLREALELAMQICDAVPNRLQNHEEPSVAYIGTLVNQGITPDTSACFGYYAHIRDALALPTDDSALQERLAAEREQCALKCEFIGDTGFGSQCAAAIRALT